jgi:glycosyltransferase involved in cell wall biosynthesis
MGKLVSLMPGAILLVTGPPGPHNPKNAEYLIQLKDLRDTMGLRNHLFFLYEHGDKTGTPLEIPDKVMADLYQVADLMIFPSREEGFGIPVLEAGLARLPVFASDIPPVRESGAGWVNLFNRNDSPHTVAHAISDYLTRDSAWQLRKRVLKNFTWKSIWEKKLKPLMEGAFKMVRH